MKDEKPIQDYDVLTPKSKMCGFCVYFTDRDVCKLYDCERIFIQHACIKYKEEKIK